MDESSKYYVHGGVVFAINEFERDGKAYVVTDDGDGEQNVYLKSALKKWEETYAYQEQEKRKLETAKINEQRKELIVEIQKEAFKKLQQRLRMNLIFSEDSKLSVLGIGIAEALGTIIKEMEVKPLKDGKN